MDFRIFTEPQQGAGYDRLITLAKAAEELDYSGFFVSDHYLVMGDADPRNGPTDAFVTLAGLARETEGLRLGTLVTPITFRRPGQLALIVAQVDDMSGGRLELGVGAGWYDDEHAARGIPFPSLGERFDLLEDQVEMLTKLWNTPPGETFSFSGEHLELAAAPAVPQPVQQGGVPLIVGGFGPKRTPALAARYAAEFNMPFASPKAFTSQRAVVRDACTEHGRDPDSLTFSTAQVVCVGADDAEVERRASNIGREAAELIKNGVGGTPAQAVEKIGKFAEAGASRIYLQVLDEDDVDHIALIASDVLSQL